MVDMQRQELVKNDYKCIFCGTEVEQYDCTAGGADSNYGNGAAAEFDYPATVTCEGPEDGPYCGAEYCDGDLVADPPGMIIRCGECNGE